MPRRRPALLLLRTVGLPQHLLNALLPIETLFPLLSFFFLSLQVFFSSKPKAACATQPLSRRHTFT
eukprot:m.17009 g.17009  ORF g.17009 m.17009 type:complete len:66 (-) comp7028_c1_seq1:25-222(-)